MVEVEMRNEVEYTTLTATPSAICFALSESIFHLFFHTHTPPLARRHVSDSVVSPLEYAWDSHPDRAAFHRSSDTAYDVCSSH